MSNIRVGMIRCDIHGWYYGVLMFKHDPLALWNEKVGRGHAAYYYFYTHYNDPCLMTVPGVEGFELTRVWDNRPEVAESYASIYGPKAKVCRTFDEVSEDVDLVFIPDGNLDGSDHLKFAEPGLKKSIPTFVDKPFAADLKDARQMVQWARENRTAVLSLSMLRTLPQATMFRNRFAELNGPKFAVIKGGGTTLAGQIHAISLAQNLFGLGVETVECIGKSPLAHILLDYGQKPDKPDSGVMLCCDSGPACHCAFYASAFSELGAIHSSGLGDFQFPWGAAKNLELIREMVKSRIPSAPYEEMLECVAIAHAARIAHRERRTVSLREIELSTVSSE